MIISTLLKIMNQSWILIQTQIIHDTPRLTKAICTETLASDHRLSLGYPLHNQSGL
jgi:hypothetical protein